MSTQPEHADEFPGERRTPDVLFSSPACTHIISPPRRHFTHTYFIQDVHLERLDDGFKATYSIFEKSVFVPELRVEEYSDLEAFYQLHTYGKEAIWLDISTYPALPYNTRYEPFADAINIGRDRLGNYMVYGPTEISTTPHPYQKRLRPLGTWLIVQHPEETSHVVSTTIVGGKRGKRGIAFNNFLHRKGFYKFIIAFRVYAPFSGKQRVRIEHHPAFLTVYGQPPMNWREAERHSILIEMRS